MAHNWSILVGGSGGGGGSNTLLDLTLTADTNITSPIASPAAGLFLSVFLTQNGTGGWTITWDSIFRYPPTGLSTVAHTISSMIFVSRVDPADSVVRWWLMGQPVTNKL